MSLKFTQKLIQSHLVSGEITAGWEIELRIDRSLTYTLSPRQRDILAGGSINYYKLQKQLTAV